jgi:hypothetical protein
VTSTVVFWGDGSVDEARRREREGARLLAFTDEAAEALAAAGVPHRAAADLISVLDQDRIDEAAMAWTKDFGRRPLKDGLSFRELFAWKGVSLWWFAELYLHHSTRSPGYVRHIATFLHLLEHLAPTEVEAVGLPPEETLLLARTCTIRGVLFADHPPVRLGVHARVRSILAQSRRDAWKVAASAVKARLGGGAPPSAPTTRTILFLSHAAFWRERDEGGATTPYEHYFDRVLPAVAAEPGLTPFVLAVGPRAAHRRRSLGARVRDWVRLRPEAGPYVHVNRYVDGAVVKAVREVRRTMGKAFAELRHAPATREAFTYAAVSFGDLAEPDLAATLLLQVPWAVRSYEEIERALAHVRPAAVCLYAESSGWGRATLAAARAASVPTVALQHGILYPKYYSYRHDPDEAESPLPSRTAVFGEEAKRLLVELGRYPPDSLEVTGSPKFDALLEKAESVSRNEVRGRLGVTEGERLLLVASRFRGIRGTHQALGSAFPGLVKAVERLSVRCLVKPHPAEPADGYRRVIDEQGSARVEIASPGADLVELLLACDALCTVESLSAVEALVLGRPVLLLNMPTNLRRMAEQEVARGVPAGEDPLEALREVLFDEGTRTRLAAARQRYLGDLAHGVDGQATARIVALLRRTAMGVSAR